MAACINIILSAATQALSTRHSSSSVPGKTTASVASVNSTSSQISGVFDFSTPDWMEIKGLVDELVIDEMTMAIFENPAFIPGGTKKEPAPLGDSPVWQLPGWQFERLIAEVAVEKVDAEVFAPADGVLSIVVAEGRAAGQGSVIGTIA